jgi:hypothetical protein
MSEAIDQFLDEASLWSPEMRTLRPILLRLGLSEDLKWGKPCFGTDRGNVAIMQPMKNFLALMFFNGAFLADPSGILEQQGPNSRSARRVCLRSIADVERLAPAIAELVAAAVVLEQHGPPVAQPQVLQLVAELRERLEADSKLRTAFEKLTPGRRREYNIYISGAKQVATREARVTKCSAQILAGKGLRDR